MKRKWLCFLLMVVMTVSVMGCGTANDGQSGTEAGAVEEKAEADAADEEVDAEAEEDPDEMTEKEQLVYDLLVGTYESYDEEYDSGEMLEFDNGIIHYTSYSKADRSKDSKSDGVYIVKDDTVEVTINDHITVFSYEIQEGEVVLQFTPDEGVDKGKPRIFKKKAPFEVTADILLGTWVYEDNYYVLKENGEAEFHTIGHSTDGGPDMPLTLGCTWTLTENGVHIAMKDNESEVDAEIREGENGLEMVLPKSVYVKSDVSVDPIIGNYSVFFILKTNGEYMDFEDGHIEFNGDQTFSMSFNGTTYSGTWQANGKIDSSIDTRRTGYDMMQQGQVLSTAWYSMEEDASDSGYGVVVSLDVGGMKVYIFAHRNKE